MTLVLGSSAHSQPALRRLIPPYIRIHHFSSHLQCTMTVIIYMPLSHFSCQIYSRHVAHSSLYIPVRFRYPGRFLRSFSLRRLLLVPRLWLANVHNPLTMFFVC